MIRELKRGDRVSLNVAKRPFYFQPGEFSINLIAGKQDMAIIHEKITDEHLAQINHDMKAGHLIPGWPEKKADPIQSQDDLPAVLEMGRNKINDWMTILRDDKKVKSEVKVSQIEKIIALEKSGKNRSSVILAAEGVLSYMGGVSPVVDSETEKVEIKLTAGNSEEAAVK